jgi:hypothetical protein
VLDEKIDWRISLRNQLSGNAAAADVTTGKTFYADDADTQLTGTYTPPAATTPGLTQQNRPSKTRVKYVENPADEALLMGVSYYLIKSRRLKRELTALKVKHQK